MPGPVQSIERAAAVLRLLAAAQRSLGLVEMSTALDLAKGTTHGILTTLKGVGFVEQDRTTGRYRLGEGLLHLSNPGMDPNELRSRATNLADSLASRSGLAVRIAVLSGTSAQIVHHVFRPDDTPQTLEVGRLLPAHACALGKVLLAFDLSVHTHAPAQLEGCTWRTITDPVMLSRALAAIRGRGWADEREELLPGEAAVAAPLRAVGGLVVGAIAAAGPTDRLSGPRGEPSPAVVSAVCDTARAVSHELGDLR